MVLIVAVVIGVGTLLHGASSVDAAQTIKVATWNLRDLSTSSRNDFERFQISYLLRDFDLIAIQEVNDAQVVQDLVHWLHVLGHNFSFEVSEISGSGGEGEHYAFLWRTGIVEQAGAAFLASDDVAVARPPYIGRFRTGDLAFTIISTHVCSGCGGLNLPGRRGEVAQLTTVFQTLAETTDEPVLLMGDFNLNPSDGGFSALRTFASPLLDCSNEDICKAVFPTTTRETNSFDNIWMDAQASLKFTGNGDIVQFDETLFEDPGGDSDHYREQYARFAVSDHRPVWIELADD